MARTKRSAKLDTRNARFKLEPDKDHQDWTAQGRYLKYRRPRKGGSGSWYARMNQEGKILQARLGTADDYQDADGIDVLDYDQAYKAAEKWFKGKVHAAHLEASGEAVNAGPYTVANALHDYFEDGDRRGMKGLGRDRQRAAAWITPELGGVEVPKLTRTRIESWLAKVAESPRRVRTKKPQAPDAPVPKPRNYKVPRIPKAAPVPPAPPATDDEKRARKDSANRVLTILKAALNHALDRRRVTGGEAWQSVKPYRGTTNARVRFLSAEDQVRLVNACPADFKNLVRGALLTGARYGELARLRVEDFNSTAGTVFIAESKSGKPRHVVLTEEGKRLFVGLTAGKDSSALVFQRHGIERRKREEIGQTWGHGDAGHLMAEACTAAELESLTFHELRHSYASMLVNKGVPLAYVAAQLGHADTRMTEKHYGHLAPSALADAIRAAMPNMGLMEPQKIVDLKISSGA